MIITFQFFKHMKVKLSLHQSLAYTLSSTTIDVFCHWKWKRKSYQNFPFSFSSVPDVLVAYNQECLEIPAKTVECSFFLNTLQYFLSWPQLLPNPSAAAFARKLDFHSFLQFPLLVNGSPENWTKKVYSWSSCKQPPKMSSLGSWLPEVVAYESLDHIGTKCFLVRTC